MVNAANPKSIAVPMTFRSPAARGFQAALDLAAFAVCRHRDIHLLGPRQVRARHDRDELLDGLAAAEPRVARLLLPDAADPPLLIIVAGIDEGLVGQA